MLLPLAALVTGCRYDDSEVWEELNNHEQRILALEKAINTDLASVQGIVAELQNKVYVSAVTPTANGFTLTFTDGKSYTVTNGTSGETPNIGVKKDTDGNYYWTLNGEWLKDADGNKIRTTGDQGVAGITPQVKIQDNKWYVSIDNGQTWTEAGAATVVGDSLFKEVKLDADGKNVIFTFQDGSTITIPVVPVVKKLQLIFDETKIASIMSGATATVDYEISGPEDETVEFDTFENNGYKVVVTPADATKGTIAVTAPDPAVKGKVLFILTGSKGSSFVKTVTINANPAVTPDKTEYNVDSKAGEVEINVAANIAYTSTIVATKAEDITWITKGSAENKFVVTENATLEDRSVNIVFSAEGVKDVTVKLTQACKDAIVVTAEDLSKEIVATEGTLDIVIRTNVEVTATPDVDWITLNTGTKALADKKFSFNIAANTGVTRTGHIDFTAGELKQTVTVTQSSGPAYVKVSKIEAGTYIIAAASGDVLKAFTPLSGNYGYAPTTDITPVDGQIVARVPGVEFTFAATDNGYTILGSDGKYFYLSGTYNSFNVSAEPTEGQFWNVAFETDGTVKITNAAKEKWIQYTTYGTYGAYSSDQSGAVLPSLYKVFNTTAPTVATVKFAKASETVEVGKTVKVSATTNSDATVIYKTGDENIAKVEADGTITGVAAGEVTITASVAATEKFTAATATCKVTVTESAGGGSVPSPETITFADLGLENGVQYKDPFNGGHFTITFAGGSNDGKYYTTGSAIRVYGGGSMTIASSTNTISKIEFTWDGTNAPSDDVATPTGYSTTTKAWEGSSKSIVLTRPSGSGHWRLKAIKVTYSE